MRRPVWTRSARPPPKARRPRPPGAGRDRLAVLLALVTMICLGATLFASKDSQFLQLLMPGPLTSAHGAIENCSACHANSGSSKLSWLHRLGAGDPLADSKACLGCHRMPDTAFYAHGALAEVLDQSTKRLAKLAAGRPVPQSARAQSLAFPTDDMVAHGVYCATCHQEHQGVNFSLNKISNQQCQSCHALKFDSFDGHHPNFDNYPFKRRQRIIYDHAGHFGKHFPEVAKKDPARRIPATCSTCHNSRKDKRIMAVAPFEQTCTACHLEQIVGKERVSGPKGIAFLNLPGLDLQTLNKKQAAIGEWPDASEAELTPFMKVMIGRNQRGRALIKAVDALNLQDLSGASDAQIKAVTTLAWEIKRLFYALIKGKASDVLANLSIEGGSKLSATLVADLTASIPRDVIIAAQQQWLPNLGTEMAALSEARLDGAAAKIAKPSRLVPKNQPTPPNSAPGAIAAKAAAAEADGEGRKTDAANAKSDKKSPAPEQHPQAKAADQTDDLLNPTEEELRGIAAPSKGAQKAAQPDAVAKTDTPNAKPGNKALVHEEQPQAKAVDQTDDLLNPTEEELRGIAAPSKGAEQLTRPAGVARKADTANAKSERAAAADATPNTDAKPQADAADPVTAAASRTNAAPAHGIDSDVDPENWADYGGWYRQDYAIFYRPIGHKDKFIYSWLLLTGPKAPKADRSPAAAVFDVLTGKDAQGSCTKCHSVDDLHGHGRVVNFSPPSVESKLGRFTTFIHEPHFGLLDKRGCLTCHNLEKGRPYLQSYEQGDPKNFVSNFGPVKKDLCQSCHTSGLARQDCLLCHRYHVNGVVTPIMNTTLPNE